MIKLTLTAPQLCELADIEWKRFETMRRRAMAALDVQAGSRFEELDADAVAAFPVRHAAPGKWSRYDFEDALKLGCAVELEAAGYSWKAATQMVLNARAERFLELPISSPDFWIGRVNRLPGDAVHVAGTRKEVLSHVDATVAAFALLNVSAVARKLIARAAELGIPTAEND